MCCEQELGLCVGVEVPLFRKWCNGLALEPLAVSAGSPAVGLGISFLQCLAVGRSVVLLVKKEDAPRGGGGGAMWGIVFGFITLNRFLLHITVRFCLLSLMSLLPVSKLQLM